MRAIFHENNIPFADKNQITNIQLLVKHLKKTLSASCVKVVNKSNQIYIFSLLEVVRGW